MADTVTKKRCSEIMASTGQKNTIPEMVVRSFLHRKGLRYRLHAKDLPGKPDLVFPRLKTALFVNGFDRPPCVVSFMSGQIIKDTLCQERVIDAFPDQNDEDGD